MTSTEGTEGYVLHSYGPERYLKHAVASVHTLRRYDRKRPVALFCPLQHRALLEQWHLADRFQVIKPLPEPHRSIVGFKHSLHRFKAFDRSLFVDADMIWCRDPDPLWQQLAAFDFTATGLQRADHFFGGPKGVGVVADVLLQRRTRTLQHFGLTHLPRVQAGMIYAQDSAVTRDVADHAAHYLSRVDETHFRSRLNEGRREETCEWSLAMAMSKLQLPIFPWLQGHNSPQLDYIDTLTTHDPEFAEVTCRYYSVPFVYNFRGIPARWLRSSLFGLAERLPGAGDHMDVTPYVLHFGWLHQKQPFYDFANRIWTRLVKPSKNGVAPVATPATTPEPPTEPTAETKPEPAAEPVT
jgi:hypothetical protein